MFGRKEDKYVTFLERKTKYICGTNDSGELMYMVCNVNVVAHMVHPKNTGRYVPSQKLCQFNQPVVDLLNNGEPVYVYDRDSKEYLYLKKNSGQLVVIKEGSVYMGKMNNYYEVRSTGDLVDKLKIRDTHTWDTDIIAFIMGWKNTLTVPKPEVKKEEDPPVSTFNYDWDGESDDIPKALMPHSNEIVNVLRSVINNGNVNILNDVVTDDNIATRVHMDGDENPGPIKQAMKKAVERRDRKANAEYGY